MSRLSGKELAQELERFVNGGSNEDIQEFITHFQRMHRTLQQKAFGAVVGIVEAVASPDYGRDGRNIESHNRAKMMIDGLKKEMVNELIASGDGYWTKEKAEKYIYGDMYKVSSFPMI